jgi:hypothetical protein
MQEFVVGGGSVHLAAILSLPQVNLLLFLVINHLLFIYFLLLIMTNPAWTNRRSHKPENGWRALRRTSDRSWLPCAPSPLALVHARTRETGIVHTTLTRVRM